MPTYEVEMNGQKFHIDAPDDQSVNLAVKQLHEQNQPTFADKAGSNLNASASGFANGIPIVGPAFNEGLNKAEAGIRTLWDGDKTYQQELDKVHTSEQGDIAANPVTHGLAQVAGGVYGTLPAAMAAPAAFGAGVGPILGRMAISGATGAGIGGADSAVRSGGELGPTLAGAGVGLLAGGAGPLIAKGVGAGVRAMQGSADDALTSLSRPAQNYVEGQFANPAKVAAQQAQLQTLGPEATLADVSPEWLGVARGAAAQPGMRDAIVEPLNARSAMANPRIRADMDANLGQAVIPSQVEQGLAASRDTVAQNYGPVMGNARAVDTTPIAEGLDSAALDLRGPAQQAVQRVRGYLNLPGAVVDGQPVLDPNPQALMATRQAIDGLVAGETNPQVVRQLTIARQQVDDALAQAAPGVKGVDAQYSELARQSDALQQGRPILNNEASAIRPQELDQMLTQGALPQGEMVGPSAVPTRMRQGARAEIDRAIGTKANDVTALRQIVRGEGDWNRAKLGSLFGQDNADRALSAIDRESVYADTANRVTRGSDTAMGNQFGKFLSDTGKAGNVPADSTLTGIGVKGAKKLAEVLLNRNAEAAAQRYASEIGNLSIAQGPSRDAIVQALMQRGQSAATSSNPQMQALISALSQSTGRQTLR